MGGVDGACVNVTSSHLAATSSSSSSSPSSSDSSPSPFPNAHAGGNASTEAPHSGWRLAFCGRAPATVWVPLNTSEALGNASAVEAAVARQDARAAADFNKMLRVLATFDCSRKYSYFTCDQCKAYYKRWICLMRLPRCTMSSGDQASQAEADMPCLDACTDVLRACPYNIDFSCPSAQSLFGHDYSIEASTCDPGLPIE